MRNTLALLVLLVVTACEAQPELPKHPPATHAASSGTADAAFVASKNSDKFHRPTCEWAAKITAENLRTFKTAEEAFRAGLKACDKCKP